MKRIEYLIKHNSVIQFLYRHIFSLFFQVLGLFVKKDDKLIIFSSFGGKKFNDSPKVIFEKMVRMHEFEGFRFVWAFTSPKDYLIEHAEVVKINSLKYFILCLKAKVWITSVNIERGLHFKKRGTYYVNTWHGAGTKKIGNACSGRKDYDFSDVDLMLVQSDFEKEIFVRDFNCKKENIEIVGFPRNDALFQPSFYHKRNDIKEELSIPDKKRIILYAPTWRDSIDGGISYKIEPPINIDYWRSKLGDKYVILFKAHTLITDTRIQFDDFIFDVSNYGELNNLLSITDILVTDYSTIVYDSAVARIPFLCFGYDYDKYKEERGFYYDLNSEYPNGVIKNEDDLIEKILEIKGKKAFSEKYESFRKKYIQAGGESLDFVVSRVLAFLNNNILQ